MSEENEKTVTTTISKGEGGAELLTTTTEAGAAEVVTTSKTKSGDEVTTTVRTTEVSPKTSATDDDFEKYIAIWSKAVDTQMHFNEMSVKSRQLGLTFVVAALGLAVVLASQKKDYSFDVFGLCQLHVAVLLILTGVGAIGLVRMLDLGVYHRMLRGAVAFGEDFEERVLLPRLGAATVELGMTQAISFVSRKPNARFDRAGSPRYTPGEATSLAGDRLKGFYRLTMITLGALALLVFIVTCRGPAPEPAPPLAGSVAKPVAGPAGP